MPSTWINQLGNWNPQLLREIRGRLKLRSVIAAIAISLVVQALLLLSVGQTFSTENAETSRYIWLNLFRTLTWIIPAALFTVGSYSLIGDISQEERRGTLNFLRFSPRTSQNILLGKILGVPLLPYLSVLLFVPLHVISAMSAQVSLSFMVSFYLMLVGGCALFFSIAVLAALLSGVRGFLASATAPTFGALTLFMFAPLFMTWSLRTVWSQVDVFGQQNFAGDVQWYYASIASNVWFSHLFTLLNIGIMTFAIWQVLRRRFHNPTATVLSKQQSYAIMAYLELLFLGFFCCTSDGLTNQPAISPLQDLFVLYGVNFFCFLILIAALIPQRQAVLDWLRYDRRGHAGLTDLIWAEKSPAPVAIGINLIIINALLVPWILLWQVDGAAKLVACLILVPFALVMLIYAVITQRILISKISKPAIWSTGILATLLFLPPITLGLLTLTPENAPVIWIFFGFPWLFGSSSPALPDVLIAIAGQVIVLGFLSWQLNQQLKKLA